MRDRVALISLIIVCLICTGCWDRVEIEELGIIAGIGIDRAQNAGRQTAGSQNAGANSSPQNASSQGDIEDMHIGNEQKSLLMTFQYIVPKSQGGSEGGKSTPKKPYSNLSGEGDSISHILSDIYSISSRNPRYDHLKVMIISDEIARSYNLYKLLNALLRHPEMPRNVGVVISEGKAGYILETTPKLEDLPAFELNMLTRIKDDTSNKPPVLTVGELAGKLAQGASFAVQRTAIREGAMQVTGTAVIRGGEYKFAGWLNESETEGLNWLTGKMAGGAVEIKDKKTGETIACRISKAKSKIVPRLKDENLSFLVEIESEAIIAEDWLIASDALEQEYIKKVEKEAAKEVKDIITKTLNKIQKECKADVANFGKQLKIKHPDIWEKMKDGWDDRFSNIPVEVNVRILVRTFGRRISK